MTAAGRWAEPVPSVVRADRHAVSVPPSPALTAALDAIDEAVPLSDPDRAHQVIAATCRGLMFGYEARWAGTEWAPVRDAAGKPHLEQTIHLPIINPETGRASRTWTQAGKFDGVVTGYGRTLLLEHKTVSKSEDIADPSSAYWRRLAIDAQVSAYMLQSWQCGEKLDGSLYDVIRKPGIRPKAITKRDVEQITTSGQYLGVGVSAYTIAAVASGVTDEADALELYTVRLALDTLTEPGRYYQRRQITRLDADVAEYAGELWAIGQEILAARNNDRHYRNSAACLEYGRPCEYLGICSGFDAADSDRWQRSDRVHVELDLDAESGGRSVLTHSRIKTFQTCRRKHHFRYELGLRRIDEEESEALYLGSTIHRALEAWWANQNANQHNQGDGHVANNCSGIALDQPAIAAP